MNHLLLFNKDTLDGSSRSEDDDGANVDLLAVPSESLANIVATQQAVTLYFKDGNGFASEQANLAQVELKVFPNKETNVVKALWKLFSAAGSSLIEFNDVISRFPVDNIREITTISRFGTERFPSLVLTGDLNTAGQSLTTIKGMDITLAPDAPGDVILGNFKFDVDQTVGAGQDNHVLTYDNSTTKISLEAATGVTYGVSCVDGDNADEEKIRLTGSDASTDDVVLEAAGSLTIARSSDKITLTNSRANMRMKGDTLPCGGYINAVGYKGITLTANRFYAIPFWVDGQMNVTHIGIQTGASVAHDIVGGIYKYTYADDSWTKVVQVAAFNQSVTGKQSIALSSTETLTQGIYFVGLHADGAQTNVTGYYGQYLQNLTPGFQGGSANRNAYWYFVDQTYNATMPSSFASGDLAPYEYTGLNAASCYLTLG